MKFVITRPLENCEMLVGKGDFIFLPAFKYVECDVNDNDFSKKTSFILTSQKASLFCIKNGFCKNARYYCVGKKTASPLYESGFENVFYPGKYNVESLIKLVVHMHKANENYAYLSGDVINTPIHKKLKAYNISCSHYVVYKTQMNYHLLKKILMPNELYTFVFYSLQSYNFFVENMKQEGVLDICASSNAYFVLPSRTKAFVLAKINGIEWGGYEVFPGTEEFLHALRDSV